MFFTSGYVFIVHVLVNRAVYILSEVAFLKKIGFFRLDALRNATLLYSQYCRQQAHRSSDTVKV